MENHSLQDAKPTDRPHLLIWNHPTALELERLCFENNAQAVNYPNNLLSRIDPSDQFLTLHHHIDREIDAIRNIAAKSNRPIVVLKGLDYLMTYLHVRHGATDQALTQKLRELRQLHCLVWILLPSKLIPKNWPQERVKNFQGGVLV